MSTITKRELIDRIAESTQAKRALVKATVQNFLDEIISELAKGNRLLDFHHRVSKKQRCRP